MIELIDIILLLYKDLESNKYFSNKFGLWLLIESFNFKINFSTKFIGLIWFFNSKFDFWFISEIDNIIGSLVEVFFFFLTTIFFNNYF